jgi:hypothetical protein
MRRAARSPGPGALLAVIVLALLVGGCTARPASRSGDLAPATTMPTASAPTAARGVSVRGCASSVWGQLDPTPTPDDVVAGPLQFRGGRSYRSLTPAELRDSPTLKVLVLVEAGATVTVTIPERQRSHAALLYLPSKFDASRVRDGDWQVTFRGCRAGERGLSAGRRHTQFNGGFVVDGPRCLSLEVRSAGGAPKRVALPFAVGRCPGA